MPDLNLDGTWTASDGMLRFTGTREECLAWLASKPHEQAIRHAEANRLLVCRLPERFGAWLNAQRAVYPPPEPPLRVVAVRKHAVRPHRPPS